MARFGEELLHVFGGGAKSSYQAKGWHAQLVQLTGTKAGYAAADRVGISVTRETLTRWLSQRQEPSAANRRLIDRAYAIVANRWNPANERRKYAIHGEIDSGDRTEERTLRIGEGDYHQANWTRIEDLYNSGVPSDPEKRQEFVETLAEYFIDDVIVADIGETTGEWDFPGENYTITAY